MYQYSENQRTLLNQRAEQFQGQVDRFKRKELDSELFQQLRLRNGLYQERHAHMLRVAIPYGTLSSTQLRKLAQIAKDYDKGYAHFTTRQNIQFNWPELENVPNILRDLATVDMHGIQTSGSCIRNISCDHLAGVAKDEIADPRPWCEIIRQWANLHPEFNWLPRKFKFSVTGALQDRAVIRMNDIGLQIVDQDDKETYFDVYVGGGMGRTPMIGKLSKKRLAGTQLLPYLQAVLRVYNQYGRRDHKYKSRIKILVNALGLEEFNRLVAEEFSNIKAKPPLVDTSQLRALKFQFEPRQLAVITEASHIDIPVNEPAYLRWLKTNTIPHKLPSKLIVFASLKAPGRAPGNVDTEQMLGLAAIADKYSQGELRVSHTQNIFFPHVEKNQLYAVWRALSELSLATTNMGHLSDMIACPGYDYCSLANTTTLDIAREINNKFTSLIQQHDLGEIRLNISGCMNSCGHHHVADIGILGVDKRGEQCYQITLGGTAGIDTKLGKRIGPAIDKVKLPSAIENIVGTFIHRRHGQEKFSDCIKRIGITPFKEQVYANH